MIFFSAIAKYCTASTSEAAYIIGGSDYITHDVNDFISEFKDNSWRKMGTTARVRMGLESITLKDETMVIDFISG